MFTIFPSTCMQLGPLQDAHKKLDRAQQRNAVLQTKTRRLDETDTALRALLNALSDFSP